MHLDSLKIFCDVVHTGSFSQAARLNHVSQSAVTQQIQGLEKKLGAQLVERTGQGVLPTPEGRLLLHAGESVQKIIEEATRKIQEIRGQIHGVLKVATVLSIGLHELPPHVRAFQAKHPEAKIEVSYRKASQIYADVLQGVVDIGLVAFPKARRGLGVHIYAKDKLVVICNPQHPFASAKTVKLADLNGQAFISFEPDTPTRQALDRLLKANHIHVKQTMEFDNIETVKRAVEVEGGISIVPLRTVDREILAGTLLARDIADHPAEAWRPLGILRRRSKAISPLLKAFIEHLELREAEAVRKN